MQKLFKVFFLLIASVFLVLFGYFYKEFKINSEKQKCKNLYSFLNSNIKCDFKRKISKKGYVTLRNQLMDYFAGLKNSENSVEASLYFRDLNNGPLFGINEETAFIPASLLKVPLFITYLNLAEEEGELLSKKIEIKLKTLPPNQKFAPEKELKENTPYSIRQLLENTIIYSDNRAYLVLLQYLKDKYPQKDLILNTYQELGIIDPKNTTQETITVRAYASIFRILYNASYLSPENSNRALEILAKSEFKDGVVKGVQNGIKVAHKFGERYGLSQGLAQLHDCGIIYFPENPYILCVMTKGKNIQSLLKVIQTVSSEVYKEVSLRQL